MATSWPAKRGQVETETDDTSLRTFPSMQAVVSFGFDLTPSLRAVNDRRTIRGRIRKIYLTVTPAPRGSVDESNVKLIFQIRPRIQPCEGVTLLCRSLSYFLRSFKFPLCASK